MLLICRNYIKRRRNDSGMGRPSFRSASVALRGAGFGDSSALKVSESCIFQIYVIYVTDVKVAYMVYYVAYSSIPT